MLSVLTSAMRAHAIATARAVRDGVFGVTEPPPPIAQVSDLDSAMAGKWLPWDGPLTARPRNRAELIALLGDPTRGGLYLKVADPKWVKRSIVELHGETAFLPVLAPSYFPIHRLLETYAREAFRRADLSCPGYIQRKGTWGYNHRRIRHDTPAKAKKEGRPLRPLSLHALGAAIDINPQDNRTRTFAPGKAPEPWSPEWSALWPRGLPPAVVEAFESCGWAWGGRWRGFCDPMHFQWVGTDEIRV